MDAAADDIEQDAKMALDARLARLGPNQRALLDERLHRGPVSGHRLVAQTLGRLDVTHVYGVPGQPVYDTFGACAKAGLRVIGTHHQQPAALMAAAHNYFAGRQKATTIVSTGVPAANALGAVVVARDNCWPLVVLAGAAPLAAAGHGYFMALDAAELYRPVTKWATRVTTAHEIPGAIAHAFEAAMHGQPGPVLVELPEDVLTAFAPGGGTAPPSRALAPLPEPDAEVLKQAAAMLMGARRPLLIVGEGVRWASPFAALRELVDALALPFITSPVGRGTIPDDHPYCMNAIPWVAQSAADLVLVLGARLDWAFRYGRQLPDDARIIQVDADVAEFDRVRKATLGIHGDVGVFLRALIVETGMISRKQASTQRDVAWLGELRHSRRLTEARREARAGDDAYPTSPLRLAREIRDALPPDAITIFDSNLVLAACQRMIPAHAPVSRITPGRSGCMGGGLPYAIAAKLEHPGRPVVAICGDFAFGITVMELETAVRHNVPIVVVVANNDGNSGSLRQRMHMGDSGGERIMTFQPGLRYDRIMAMFGGHAEHVDRTEDIGPALMRALAGGRPACINVAVDPDAPFPDD
jgi:thiamine pyrophosphate-dependent acetolactate synthase large subunit-like protein